MKSDPKKMLKKHDQLTHSEELKVVSHTQREQDGWFINSIMIENCEVPFKYKRKKRYKTISPGQKVNLTYYPEEEIVAGLQFDYMKVVRIKTS